MSGKEYESLTCTLEVIGKAILEVIEFGNKTFGHMTSKARIKIHQEDETILAALYPDEFVKENVKEYHASGILGYLYGVTVISAMHARGQCTILTNVEEW